MHARVNVVDAPTDQNVGGLKVSWNRSVHAGGEESGGCPCPYRCRHLLMCFDPVAKGLEDVQLRCPGVVETYGCRRLTVLVHPPGRQSDPTGA